MALETFANGEVLSSVRGKINTNFTTLEKTRFDNVVAVKTKSDLGDVVGGVITLATDGLTYIFDSVIDLGSDTLVITGDGVKLEGNNVFSSGLSSSTTGVLITASKTIVIEKMTIIDLGSKTIEATNSGTDSIIIRDSAFLGAGTSIEATDYQDIIVDTCSFNVNANAISLNGTMTNAIINGCKFVNVSGICIDLNACVSRAFSIDTNIAVLTGSTTFLTIDANGDNLLPDGAGTVFGNKIDNTLNGTITSGYSPFDTQWTVLGNNLITNSDALEPSGWGFYVDDNSSQLSVGDDSANPTLIEINGLGSNSNSDYLPPSIQGVSELWHTGTDEIIPVTKGDSYALRLQVTIDSAVSNPQRLNFMLDIGGQATPSVVIAEQSFTLKNGTPQTHAFTLNYFTLDSFVSNGGKIFVYCDNGSVTIGARQILIERISSGVR